MNILRVSIRKDCRGAESQSILLFDLTSRQISRLLVFRSRNSSEKSLDSTPFNSMLPQITHKTILGLIRTRTCWLIRLFNMLVPLSDDDCNELLLDRSMISFTSQRRNKLYSSFDTTLTSLQNYSSIERLVHAEFKLTVSQVVID